MTVRHRFFLTCILLTALTFSSAHAALLFKDSFDNRSFAGFNPAGNDTARIVSAPVRAGAGAANLSLDRRTDRFPGRTELVIVNPKPVIGQTYWLSVSHYMPASWVPDSAIDVVYNIHSRPDPGEDVDGAPFSLRIFRDRWNLVVRGDPNRRSPSSTTVVRNFDLGPVQKEQWTDWVFRIVLSYQANARLEAWKNRVKILDYAGPNVYNDALGPFIKFGIYKPDWRASPITSSVTQRTLFIDEVRVGDANSNFAEVSPGGGATPIPQPGSVQFATTGYSVNEGGGTAATITATRVGGSTGPVSVNYTTAAGGTASAGLDYGAVSGTLSWADGDAIPKAFSVPIGDDGDIEGNETVGLALSTPTGATLGTPNTATLTITDNDQAPPPTFTCGGQAVTIMGTAASETITGTAGADVIDGLGGNDLIGGLEGDDILCGEEGNDTLQSSLGNDQAFGENGDDIVRGGDGNDRVNGDDGTDQVFGDQLNDALTGGAGTDRCDGGTGTDTAATCESGVNIP